MGMDAGLDIDEGIQVMRWLADDGIDYGHISSLAAAGASQKYPEQVAPRASAKVSGLTSR